MVSTSAILSLLLYVAACQALGFTTPMKAKRRRSSQFVEWFESKPVQGGGRGKEALCKQIEQEQKGKCARPGSGLALRLKVENMVAVGGEPVNAQIEGNVVETDEHAPMSSAEFPCNK